MPHKKQARTNCGTAAEEKNDKVENGCICPLGCSIGIPIKSPSPDYIHVECSNNNCQYVPYIHEECYVKWEKDLLQTLYLDPKRGNKWSKEFAERMLWDPKGYGVIRKKCKCTCGGFLIRTVQDDKAKKLQEQVRKKVAASEVKKPIHQLPLLKVSQQPSAIHIDEHATSVARMGARFKKQLEKSGQINNLPIGMKPKKKEKKKKAARPESGIELLDNESHISDSKSECTESVDLVENEQKENVELEKGSDEEDEENVGEWETVKRRERKPPKPKPVKRKKGRSRVKLAKTTNCGSIENWIQQRQNIPSERSVASPSEYSNLTSSKSHTVRSPEQQRQYAHSSPFSTNTPSKYSNSPESYESEEEFCADDLNQELALFQQNTSIPTKDANPVLPNTSLSDFPKNGSGLRRIIKKALESQTSDATKQLLSALLEKAHKNQKMIESSNKNFRSFMGNLDKTDFSSALLGAAVLITVALAIFLFCCLKRRLSRVKQFARGVHYKHGAAAATPLYISEQ